MGVIVVIFILIAVHVLIAVVVMLLIAGTIDHGHGTTSDQKEGLGEDQEHTRGKEGTGREGWDAQIDELAAAVGIRGPGGSFGGLAVLLPAADLRTEHRGDEEDDTAEGGDVDQEGGQDDLHPGPTTRGVGVGIHGAGRELVLLVVSMIIFVFVTMAMLVFIFVVMAMLVFIFVVVLILVMVLSLFCNECDEYKYMWR